MANNQEEILYTSRDVFVYKAQAFIVLFIIAVIGGVIPLKKKSSKSFLSYGNCFSGGIFLSAAFLHMLQESIEGFESLGLKTHFPMAMFWTIVGIMIPFLIEKVILGQHDHNLIFFERQRSLEEGVPSKNSPQIFNMYMLWLMLGIHSFIEGAAVGIEENYTNITPILIAIISHKFFSAFALGASLAKSGVDSKRAIQLVVSFSFTTPLGILLGYALTQVLKGILSSIVAEIVKAIAGGTFIYVALAEIILEEFENHHHPKEDEPIIHKDDKKKYKKFMFVVLGIGMMSVFSLWHSH